MGGDYPTPVADNTSPHELLARAFKEDHGIEINPQVLRMFILSRWDRVEKLAHMIHNGM